MTSLFTIVGRGGIPGLLTRVMREAAREHAHFTGDDFIAAAQREVYSWKHRHESGWEIYDSEYTPAIAWRFERAERLDRESGHRWGPTPRCRGGWPTVTIEEVTFFDAPHDTDGSIGTVLACYDTDRGQACALYGFKADGSITLWAN
jgi:hypothetical protein